MPNKGLKFPPEILTDEEARAVLLAPDPRKPTGARNRAIIATMWGSGLRVSELLALRTTDINFDEGTVRVLNGKGGKPRIAGIWEGSLVHVERWMEMRRKQGIRTRTLFCTLHGTPVKARDVGAMLKREAEKAGVQTRVYCHGFRHLHAATMERNGVTVTVISKQLGHANHAVTGRYLDHISPTERVQIVKEFRKEL